ncbi:isopentenyl-diphosphate delta-isomerase [Methanococcus voltae]|uniref:type 2 isopentenyl-diphosphate Delta-isomerase n=1 Tax=Methanococcus voltae TaxID=2188 RepID=UPI001AEA50C8|nr:type 2 isopentenyl-diphosphate Delta-isomerase [Methanococcus voltae]MBP2144520.1 isopentenyl-diphosphate delta-isomerase [Methanococcus voltae]
MNNYDIEYRKLEHLIVCEHCNVEYKKGTLLNNVELVHNGVSKSSLDDLDTSIELFGKKLDAPIIVAGITGGHAVAKEVNKNIAIAVEEMNLGMGLGSQRAAIAKKGLEDTYSVVRDYTSSLVIGNLGAVNFTKDNWNYETVKKAVDIIDADAMAIHFNPLQEAIQPEGDTDFRNLDYLSDVIKDYKKYFGNMPFIAKQVGEGFCQKDGLYLNKLGFDAIDVGGSGGTSWSAVEYYRVKDYEHKKLSEKYLEWGIPTAASILDVRKSFSKPLIATGGIRSGIDIAKSLALGANCCGIALPVLKAAMKSPEEVIKLFESLIKELKITMFLTGCNNINELNSARYIINGELKNWIN